MVKKSQELKITIKNQGGRRVFKVPSVGKGGKLHGDFKSTVIRRRKGTGVGTLKVPRRVLK